MCNRRENDPSAPRSPWRAARSARRRPRGGASRAEPGVLALCKRPGRRAWCVRRAGRPKGACRGLAVAAGAGSASRRRGWGPSGTDLPRSHGGPVARQTWRTARPCGRAATPWACTLRECHQANPGKSFDAGRVEGATFAVTSRGDWRRARMHSKTIARGHPRRGATASGAQKLGLGSSYS